MRYFLALLLLAFLTETTTAASAAVSTRPEKPTCSFSSSECPAEWRSYWQEKRIWFQQKNDCRTNPDCLGTYDGHSPSPDGEGHDKPDSPPAPPTPPSPPQPPDPPGDET